MSVNKHQTYNEMTGKLLEFSVAHCVLIVNQHFLAILQCYLSGGSESLDLMGLKRRAGSLDLSAPSFLTVLVIMQWLAL
jgi:hypothetical protein